MERVEKGWSDGEIYRRIVSTKLISLSSRWISPKHDAAILSSPPRVLPCLPGKICINRAPLLAIDARICGGEPSVDDQRCTGIEPIWLSGGIDCVEGIEEGGGGDLS